MFCTKCGKEISDSSIFCQFCGEKIIHDESKKEAQQEIVDEEKVSYSENNVSNSQSKIEKIINDNPHYIAIAILIIFAIGIISSSILTEHSYKEAKREYEQQNYYVAKEKMDRLTGSNTKYTELKKKIDFAIAIKEGEEHFDNKKYSEAIESYQKAQAIDNSSEITKKIDSIKTIKQNQINSLKAYMRANYDNVENITWIKDKTSPIYSNRNAFYLYMGKDKDNFVWLRLNVSYFGQNWIFWNTMIFNIDGQKTSYSLPYGEVKHDNNTMVWEVADLPYDKYADVINKVINSKTTILRLQGDNHYYDKTITSAEKQALKRMIDYYNLLK